MIKIKLFFLSVIFKNPNKLPNKYNYLDKIQSKNCNFNQTSQDRKILRFFDLLWFGSSVLFFK